MHRDHFCFILCMFVGLVPSIVHPFPVEPARSQDLYFWAWREPAKQDQMEQALAVYDNLKPSPTKLNHQSIVRHHFKAFIAVDLLAFNPFLYLIIPDPTTLENRLNNLVYANLKFKKILDEYEELQVKARNLLNLKDVTTKAYMLPMLALGKGSLTFEGQIPQYSSVWKQREILERDYRSSSGYNLSSGTHTSVEPSLLKKDTTMVAFSIERKRMNMVATTDGTSIADKNWSWLRADYGVSSSGRSSPEDELSGLESVRLKDGDKESGLLWIFRISLTVIQYLSSHRMEACLYGVVIIGFMLVATTLKRH